MPKSRGFTLAELLIVVVVIGILATIALPIYTKAMERAKDQEAITNLKLIKAGELIFYSEHNAFFGPQPADIGSNANEIALNTNLKLRLPTALPLVWEYAVSAVSGSTFSATASRDTGVIRTYTMTESTEPICSGGCN